jgi:hypothetical protein
MKTGAKLEFVEKPRDSVQDFLNFQEYLFAFQQEKLVD